MSRVLFNCTFAHPWTLASPIPVIHPDAEPVELIDTGFLFRCPHCKTVYCIERFRPKSSGRNPYNDEWDERDYEEIPEDLTIPVEFRLPPC